jgi:hypothetical protein
MCSRSEALDLHRNAVILMRIGVRLKLMGADERVVMSNEAAARRLYTRGNNEALLQQVFPTPLLLYCRHVRMTGDSHCFSEEEDDMP